MNCQTDDILTSLRRQEAVLDQSCAIANIAGKKGCRDLASCEHRDRVEDATVECIEPEFVPMSSIPPLNATLASQLSSRGITKLYKHQADAINHAMAGKNVVLEAPTASGKTLSFAVPVLESLAESRGGHALFLYPMKAIAGNQRQKFQQLSAGLKDLRGALVTAETYDGDAGKDLRKALRQNPPSILMTNVEYLNRSFLANERSWRRFLDNLKWIVIDEMHEYRGIFGTNAAMLFRRFAHHLAERKRRDRLPQFFLATATSANPLEHARSLTGQEFELVSSRDSLRPERRYIFVDPHIEDQDFWHALKHRAARLASAFDEQGMTAIIFCPTVEFAESAHHYARQRFVQRRRNPGLLRVYKGGMTAKERRKIIQDLERGKVSIVYSTNALEIGIDIAGLDAVAMVGFPDNIMSARQRLGRAGRDWRKVGTVVYLARNHPLDRFYARRLNEFLEKPLDELVTDLGNSTVAHLHGDCIWFETGPPNVDLPLGHLGEGVASRVRQIYRWGGSPPGLGIKGQAPHHRMHLRGSDIENYHLEHNGEEVGTLSRHQKFSGAYDRAILLHGGRRYRVVGTVERRDGPEDRVRKVVTLKLEPDDRRTEAVPSRTVSIRAKYQRAEIGSGSTVMLCDASIVEHMEKVTEYRNEDDREKDRWDLKTEDQNYSSEGRAVAWHIDLSVLDPYAGEAQYDREDDPAALKRDAAAILALEQLIRIGIPFIIPIDQHDVVTISDTRLNIVAAVESYPGGIGIAARIFERWEDILRQGMKIARDCECQSSGGCPYCIVPPRRHDAMNKADGIALAQRLLDLASGASAPAPFAGPASSPHQSVDG